jgi:DNA-binding transcriptional MerR regulator
MRKPLPRNTSESRLKTAEVASILGISSRTLLRKLAAGVVEEPARDNANNYRLWRPEEVQVAKEKLQRGKA